MPPVTAHILQTEHNHPGPAPDHWEPVPDVEFHLENLMGIGPKEYDFRVDVENQEGEVSYRFMVDDTPMDQEVSLPPGHGSFEKSKSERGPAYPKRRVRLEWRRISPDGGLGPGGKVRLGLMGCAWGIP